MTDSRAGGRGSWPSLVTPAFAFFLLVLVALANSGYVTSELLQITRSIPGRDKTVHFFLAGTMALLLNVSWRADHWRLGPLPIQKGSVVVLLLATFEEFSQRFVRLRSFDLEDLVFDYVGILVLGQLGAIGYSWFARTRRPEAGRENGG